jgi:NAD(P)H-hydrate epimerase
VKIVTAEIMRALDAQAMREGGAPGAVLMENAGRAVFGLLCERHGPVRGRVFHVLCGVGNNGGDGFVVARRLRLAGAEVRVSLAGGADRIRGDARVMYELMERCGVSPVGLASPQGPIVDALLGTGSQGAPRGPIAQAIDWANAAGRPIVSVDVPSGLDADTGATPGSAIRAAATVTFAYPKLGLLVGQGPECCGDLVVDDIGIDWEALHPSTPYRWIRPSDVAARLPRRDREAHKGRFGHVLITGGSRGMSGAVCLAARAALRAGAGLVTIATPESIQPTVAACVPEAMTLPLPERGGVLTEEAAPLVAEAARTRSAVCVGPGLGRGPDAAAFVFALISTCDRPLAVDADALNAIAEAPERWAPLSSEVALTPHPGEAARLLGTSTAQVQSDRIGTVRHLAARFGVVAVLKGASTLVADGYAPSGAEMPVAVNTTGNPGMATGGSGDALTGAIGAFLGFGLPATDAAMAGVYVHGRAGDLAAGRFGVDGLTAGDIADAVADAMAELRGGGRPDPARGLPEDRRP